MSRIAVIGSGAWGTALALSLSHHKSHHVRLWSHSEVVAESIRTSRENSHFLPGFSIPEKILITTSMREAAADAEIVLTVAPSHHVRHVYSELLPLLNSEQILVSATKGIEDQSYLRMSQVIAEVLARRKLDLPIAVLSGPSFAQEVAAGRPTAVTLALAGNHLLAERLQADFTSPALRIYTSEDVTGVEIGGSLKNVIAIASGIVAGLGLGSNSAAALITRGLAEITRLAVASGGRAETLSGLAGIGDLVLTATGALSAIAPSAWVLATASHCLRLWPDFTAKLPKASAPLAQPLALPASTPSRCPSPNKSPPSFTTTSRRSAP